MNTLSTLLIVSTTISLITSLIGPLTALVKAVTTIPRRIELLKDEVRTIGEILGECLTTIEQAPTKAPPHVQDLGIATYEQWKDVGELADRAWDATAPNTKSAFMSALWRIRAARYINKREGELVSAVANLRAKVGLLRDACSEIRVRLQLVEMSATMTRFADISVSSKGGSGIALRRQAYPDHNQSSDTVTEKPQNRDHFQGNLQNIFNRDFASWQPDEYILNGVVQLSQGNTSSTSQGMVAVEDVTNTCGQRFTYSPARVKIDTSPAADFVSLEYLQRVGVNFQDLDEIPPNEQRGIEGLDKIIYKPKHVVTLQWYKQGEVQMNTTQFFVVNVGDHHAPGFDLLLSSRGFAEEAERRLFSSSLMRARKTEDQIEADYQAAKKRRDAARTIQNGTRSKSNTLVSGGASTIPKTQDPAQGGGSYRSGRLRAQERDVEMGDIRDISWSSESGQSPLIYAQPSRGL